MVDFAQMFGFGEPQLAENQESEHVSYGEKLGDSMCGMCVGIVLFFGMLGTSAWNEYRNVANQKTINAASEKFNEGTCVPLQEYNQKLVHITCPVSNLDVLGSTDNVLKGIPEKDRTGLSLVSYMENFQWIETSETKTKTDKVGGGDTKTTTYHYHRSWKQTPPADVTNNFFKQGESCKTANNGYACINWDPSKVEPWWSSSDAALGTKTIDESDAPKAGGYFIPKDKLRGLGSPTVLTPTCSSASTSSPATSAPTPTNNNGGAAATNTTGRNLQQSNNVLSCSPGGDATLSGSKMYWQEQDSNGQKINYLSRTYTIYTTDTVSVLAMQTGDTFASWESPYDEDYYVYRIVDGNRTAEQMLEDLAAENVGMTWFLRFLTLTLTIVALVMITAPLTVIPDIIPCVGPWVGDLIGTVLWMVDCALGCCCWCFITSLAWIAYRPMVGIPLLCCSLCMCGGAGYLAYNNHKIKQTRLEAEAKQKEEAGNDDPEVAEDEPAE